MSVPQLMNLDSSTDILSSEELDEILKQLESTVRKLKRRKSKSS